MNLDESRPLPLHTPRIMGLETEYMVTPHTVPMNTEGLCENAQNALATPRVGQFLGNGSRVYLDAGSHPEYAGPESLSGHSVALASRAGDLIISAAVQPFLINDKSPRTKAGLFKRTLASGVKEDVAVGNHENYYIQAPGEELVALWLIPHLVSRTIFTGSGYVDACGRYSLDQRVRIMSNEPYYGGSTNPERPFVLDRGEHLSADGHRLQVLSGSANMLDAATQFKFDSTNLVIRMIEHNLMPDDLVVNNPGHAAREFAAQEFGDNFTFDRTVRVNGKKLTAPQIQLRYASIAKVMADNGVLNDYDSNFAYIWYDMAVDAVDGKIDRWSSSIDWLAKLALLERHSYAKGGASKAKLQEIDIAYHRVAVWKEKTVVDVLEKRGIVDKLFTDEEIQTAIYQSPDVTRARERGQFIVDHCDNRIVNRVSPGVTWTEWTYQMTSLGAAERRTVKIAHLSPYSRLKTKR